MDRLLLYQSDEKFDSAQVVRTIEQAARNGDKSLQYLKEGQEGDEGQPLETEEAQAGIF